MPKVRFELKLYLTRLRLEKYQNIPTQRELAILLDVSETHFSRIANGETDSISYAQLAIIITRLRKADPNCEVKDILKFIP